MDCHLGVNWTIIANIRRTFVKYRNSGEILSTYRKHGQRIHSIFFTAQNKEYTQTTMDTMEPGNLKDGYWTIYFIIMTMAVCKPIYYKPTEESFVSAESMSIIMPIIFFSCVI